MAKSIDQLKVRLGLISKSHGYKNHSDYGHKMTRPEFKSIFQVALYYHKSFHFYKETFI